MTQKFPKIVFNTQLTSKQKTILSVILTILSLVVILGVFLFLTNTTFKNFFYPDSDQPIEVTESGTSNLNNLLTSVNPDNLLYQEITYEELDIYPKSWIEKYFSSSEIGNLAFSGTSGDADGDGLTNKLEYIYGSNPRKQFSLCLEGDQKNCKGQNDKQKVDSSISPLTGATLQKNRKFRVSRQDNSILKSLQDSFETATKEGVDFPTLYQQSLLIDLSSESDQIKVTEVEDNREQLVKYTQFQIDVIKQNADSSDLDTLGNVFKSSNIVELEKLKTLYSQTKARYESEPVPSSNKRQHQLYILIYSKVVELIDLRMEAVNTNSTDTPDYQDRLKKKAVEAVWGYRILNEIG